ncbi:MAG: DMT family transporter [Bacillota bacterium]|nr:DMT family transporter [Bacillota bacterium]
MSDRLKGAIYVMFPVITWGISFVSTEYLLRSMGAMTIAAIRFAIAALIMYGMLRSKGTIKRIERGDHKYFMIAGIIGITAYFYAENLGILYLGATTSALIISTLPVFTLVFDFLIFRRRVRWTDLLAVILSVVGVALVVGVSYEEQSAGEATLGYLMMLVAVLTWVVYSVASKKIIRKYKPLELTFYQFLFSMPFFFPFIPFEQNQWQAVGLEQWVHLIFLSLFASVLGFYFYAKAMDKLGISESSVFLNFLPLVTMVSAAFYLGSPIRSMQIIGSVLIITAATLVVRGASPGDSAR